MVLTWLNENMKSFFKLGVDSSSWVSVLRNIYIFKTNFISILPALSMTNFVFLESWNHQFVLVAIRDDIWFFDDHWGLINCCVWSRTILWATIRSWGSWRSYKHHVPDTWSPRLHISISCEPLLLRSRNNISSNKCISQITSTGITSTWIWWIILEKLKISINMDSSQRTSLRNCPKERCSSCWSNMNVLGSPPEVVESSDFHAEVTILNH